MVRPVNSKRKLFITNKDQFKENEPGQLSTSKSSNLPARGVSEAPCIYQVYQTLSKKGVSSEENICESRNDRVSTINLQKRCDFEDAGNVLTPGRTVMPMSERQQIALLMQMSSPSPTNKTEISLDNPCTPSSTPYGRSVGKRNERGETPLHVAAIKGDTEKVSQLISQGANVNATDYAGWTALHEACNRGFIVIASLLINAGADINAKGLDNDTPLHDACINNHHKIVRLLLKSGANTDFLNRRGKSPRDVCRSPRILCLIEQADAGILEDLDPSELEIPYNLHPPQENHLDNTYYSRELRNSECHQYFDTNCFSESAMSRRTPPNSKVEEKPNPSITTTVASGGSSNTGSDGNNNNGNGRPSSPRVTLRLPAVQRTPDKLHHKDSKESNESEDVYEFRCSKDESKVEEKEEKSEVAKPPEVSTEVKGDKRSRETEEEEEEGKKRRKKEENKEKLRTNTNRPNINEKSAKCLSRVGGSNGSSANKQSIASNNNNNGNCTVTTTPTTSSTVTTTSIVAPTVGSTTSSSGAETRKSPVGSAANSPKPANTTISSKTSDTTTTASSKTSEKGDSDNEDIKTESNSGAPKVPPLKIVLASCANSEQETSSQNGNGRYLPYVVNSTSGSPEEATDTVTDGDKKEDIIEKEKMEITTTSVSHYSTNSTSTSNNGNTGSNVSCSSTSNAEASTISSSTSILSSSSCSLTYTTTSSTTDKVSGTRITRSRVGGNDDNPPVKQEQKLDECSMNAISTTAEVVHPRKRKLKLKEPEVEQPTTSAMPEQPISNCYEMFLRIRRQVERRRKLLFPVQPKPPQGFKDYLMNRCSYVLANSSNSHLTVPIIPPPPTVAQAMIELFNEQEQERHKLKLQQLIEKEKLVLSVEQEILRVHGRAARALANQVLPFSVCTILKDEEVYNVISAEQEEKDRNARSRYNGRLFLSWLQDVDDKWEKIKEAMVLRHHNEAESLHAVQKMDWEWKQKELGLVEPNINATIDELHVPMVQVADFDLLPV